MAVSQLWEEYALSKDIKIRNQLVEAYIVLVARQLRDMHIPQGLDREDMRQQGICGLLDAVERYNPSLGATFETYAKFRIRGAVSDHFRLHRQSYHGVSRSLDDKKKRMEESVVRLQHRLGRQPTSQEIASEMGLEDTAYFKLLGDISSHTSISLDHHHGVGENLMLVNVLQNEDATDPLDFLLEEEKLAQLESAIDNLDKRAKDILTLYHHDGLTFKEIGELMGVSKVRISQLHTESIVRLRAELKRRYEETDI